MTKEQEVDVTVEFVAKTSFGTAGVYNKGEVATFPVSTASELLKPNRHGIIVAKIYDGPRRKGMGAPPVDKQIKNPIEKKTTDKKGGAKP